jgi:hypothetical protein
MDVSKGRNHGPYILIALVKQNKSTLTWSNSCNVSSLQQLNPADKRLSYIQQIYNLNMTTQQYSVGKGRIPSCLTKYHAVKTYGRTELKPQAFLTSALDGLNSQLQRLDRFSFGERTPVPIV